MVESTKVTCWKIPSNVVKASATTLTCLSLYHLIVHTYMYFFNLILVFNFQQKSATIPYLGTQPLRAMFLSWLPNYLENNSGDRSFVLLFAVKRSNGQQCWLQSSQIEQLHLFGNSQAWDFYWRCWCHEFVRTVLPKKRHCHHVRWKTEKKCCQKNSQKSMLEIDVKIDGAPFMFSTFRVFFQRNIRKIFCFILDVHSHPVSKLHINRVLCM